MSPAPPPTAPLLLVTGASGFLAPRVAAVAGSVWRRRGVVGERPAVGAWDETERVDLSRPEGADALFAPPRPPDAVIHLAAVSSPAACDADPSRARAVNVEASRRIARRCADAGVPLVAASTDLVFDGCDPPYREEASPRPLQLYGRTKRDAEEAILAAHPAAVVVRLPLLVGVGPRTFFARMIEALEHGEPLPLFTDEVRTPLAGLDAARGLLFALSLAREERHRGLLHLAGPRRLSRWALGELLGELRGVGSLPFRPARRADAGSEAERPADVSLDASRAGRLGFRPRPLADQLREELEWEGPAGHAHGVPRGSS